VEAVQAGKLLFLSGMLPTEGGTPKFLGRVGAELDVQAGRDAVQLEALSPGRCSTASLDRSIG